MHRLLIPLLACLFLSAPALLRAQVPQQVHYPDFDPSKVHPMTHQADMMCNNAGTYTIGAFNGESNDTTLPTIYLCHGDTFLVVHNGDADLSGDPNPATPAGVGYAFYTCSPTIMGPTLQDLIGPTSTDACLLPNSPTGMWITQAVPNGGTTTFFNSGFLQTTFNMGQPMSVIFAPITVDDLSNNNYESNPGFPPGPCVNVNTAAAFEVVYLNEITATGISNNAQNDCIGRFTIRGGYPQWDGNAVYTITITLASNPNVKAIIHTPPFQLFHLANVNFSVPQAGLYNVVVEDGKSCPATFQIDMNVCNPSDNVSLLLPETSVPPGNQICVPVTADNFNVISGSFSLEWDETVLQYDQITNLNPVFDPVNGMILNTTNAANGQIGVLLSDENGNPLVVPDGGVLFEVCFDAIGNLGDCSGLTVTNTPTQVQWEDEMGIPIALTVDTGQVCIAFSPLSLNYALIDTTCLNQATLVVTPQGGVPGYEIIVTQVTPTGGPTYSGTINSGAFTVASPLGSTNNQPITYSVCVEDNNGNGAIQCATFTVDIKRRVEAQIDFTQQPLCNGDSTGVLSAVVIEGGSIVNNPGPVYTYDWQPGNGASQILSGVPGGAYTLVVTNTATGCSGVASGSLPQPPPLSAQSITVTPAACSGVCDGTILYEAEGGTPFPGGGYGWAWLNETNNTQAGAGGPNNPITLNNACAGEYGIVITDVNGCVHIDSNIVMSNQRNLTLSAAPVNNVNCNGQADGSITVNLTESSPSGQTFTFVWVPGGFTQGGTGNTSTYSDLPVGNYSVIAVDALGCQVALDTVLTEPTALTIDTVANGVVGPGCAQPNSGSINLFASGGTGGPNYTYAWNVAGTTSFLTGLPVGDYTCTVTDQNGCQDSITVNLPVPTPPVITQVDSLSVGCGSSGSLTVTAPDAIQFVWKDINGTVIDSSASISGLSGGSYIVEAIDGGGCLTVDTFTLSSVDAMAFSDTTLTPPSCFGLCDGTVAIGVQGGNPPYVGYNWNPSSPIPSPVIFGLCAGTYSVTVTDNIGCTLTGSFVLTSPPEILIDFSTAVVGRVSCFGVCDGAATPIVAYSTGGGDFTFMWENLSTDSLQTALCAGFNSVTVTDGNACFNIDSVEITTPTQITFSALTTTDALCFGDSTGTANIVATGGNGAPYSYQWSANANNAVTPNVTGLPAGTYAVTLTDKDGCSNSIDTVNIGEPGQIIVSTDFAQTQDPSCFGGNEGSVAVTVSGGVTPFNFTWEDEDMMNVGSTQVVNQVGSGTYFVTATDVNGCTGSTSLTLQDPPPVVGQFLPVAPLTCFGDETILQIDTIIGGSGGPYKFSVDFGAVLDPDFPVSLGGGQHYITYIDGQDCMIEDSIFIPEPAPITVTFDPSEVEVELGATVKLEPIITGAAVIADFTWTNPETLLNPDTLNPVAYTFNNETYTLTVVDSFGCSGEGSITIRIDPNRNVYVPNIFAPNNPTGLNQFFNVFTGLGVETVNFMRVYDRWGELMYTRENFLPDNDNLAEGWDGRFKGQFVNPGVFVYIIEVKFLDGRVLLYRGDVTVVR